MTTTLLSLTEVENAYPSGVHSVRHGCYYFLDMDGDLGYFIQYENGKFESEVNYVEFDTIDEDVAEECRRIAGYIAFYSWYKQPV